MSVLNLRFIGIEDYSLVYQRMREFTERRTEDTIDELWIAEHFPVFTQGLAGKPEHLLDPAPIPVVGTDRGGQVTYHGPGQLLVYCLLDVRRAKLNIRPLINALEQSMITLLDHHAITAIARPQAPGVYIGEKKIASLGLRIRRGASYHGISINIDNDLTPFSKINPCGYPNLEMTRLSDVLHPTQATPSLETTGELFASLLASHLGYQIGAKLHSLPEFLANTAKSI